MAKTNGKSPRKFSLRERPSLNDLNFPALCELQFLTTAKALRKLPPSPTTNRIARDFTPEFRRKRVKAMVGTREQVYALAKEVCGEAVKDFPWERYWAAINALPLSTYDLLEDGLALSLGASIWMLDQLRANSTLETAIGLLPDCNDLDIELAETLPDLWDPSYSIELLALMRQTLRLRNQDCQLPEKGGAVHPESFIDRAALMNRQKQQVPSRQRFEQLTELIPLKARKQAEEHFQTLWQDWLKRYFRSRLLYQSKEKELEERITHLKQQIRQTEQELEQKRKLLRSHRKQPLLLNQSSDPLGLFHGKSQPEEQSGESFRLERLYRELERRERQQQQLEDEIGQMNFSLSGYISGNHQERDYAVPPQILELWSDFRIGDPYELCFGFLSLLDAGDPLVWVYYPGVSVMEVVGMALPWAFQDYESSFSDRPASSFPMLSEEELPLTEHPHQMRFQLNRDDEDAESRSLAQLIYRFTGALLPRQLHQVPAFRQELAELGITDHTQKETLSVAMSLLAEARCQLQLVSSPEPEPEAASPEQSPEQEVEALREHLAQLKKENARLKATAYEAGRSLRELKKRSEELEQTREMERQELASIRELVFKLQEGETEEAPVSESIQFPYQTLHRIVSFGGHDSWAREIRPKLPGVRFVDRDQLPNSETIRRADVVWIQSNSLSHAYFYRIIEEARRYSIPVRYFSYASAVKCAEQLAAADRDMP